MSRSRKVFSPLLAAVLLVGLGAAMAVRASRAADDYRFALNDYHPPLSTGAPFREAASPLPRLTRRVVIAIIDGRRLRDSYGFSLLDALRRRGIDAEAASLYPTYTRANQSGILTGVPPVQSGVRNNAYEQEPPFESLMDRAAAAGMKSAYASDYALGTGMMFRDDFTSLHYNPWPGGFARSARLLVSEDYQVVVLVPSEVDNAGHEYGGASDEYRAATVRVDRDLADALSSLDLTRDTVIVTADHGHTDAGGHGGTERDVIEVPLILAGAGVRPGALVHDARLIDVAPTAAALLGLPAPGHALGRTLTEALAIDDATRAAIERADQRRIARNLDVIRRAAAPADAAAARTRVFRLALVLTLSILGLGALLFAWRIEALHVDWRVLAIAVPAFPVTYYALLEVVGQKFSLSGIPDRDNSLSQIFHFGLEATVVQIMAGWVALGGRVVLRDRLAAANALTACGMLIAWIPAGLMWAMFGPLTFVLPPGSTTTVLVPSTYIAVSCHALAVAVTLSLEVVVFFARAVDPRASARPVEHAEAGRIRRGRRPLRRPVRSVWEADGSDLR